MNYPGILLEGRFGFTISKKLPSDIKAAGPRTTFLGIKDQGSMKVSLLPGNCEKFLEFH